jgi:hypothetical protein
MIRHIDEYGVDEIFVSSQRINQPGQQTVSMLDRILVGIDDFDEANQNRLTSANWNSGWRVSLCKRGRFWVPALSSIKRNAESFNLSEP